MQTTQLIKRSLAYYWQTNLVVVLGVAIAVSVLAGALLIGESVRGSLRDLSSQRLGKTDNLISSANFFREQLAAELEQQGQSTCPMIALDGVPINDGRGNQTNVDDFTATFFRTDYGRFRQHVG